MSPATAATTNLVNGGTLTASNGGTLSLFDTNVGGAGKVVVSNGGILSVQNSTIGSKQTISMGGQDATTLDFNPPQASIAAKISGFDLTDLIDLQDFIGTVVASGSHNPTLRFSGVSSSSGSILPVPTSFTLHLSGNYVHDQFSLQGDAAGTGLILLVNPVA